MEIIKSDTMAGKTIVASEGSFSLTLYKQGNCFSDNISEIITELPEYDIETIEDHVIHRMFEVAKAQYEDMKKVLECDDL